MTKLAPLLLVTLALGAFGLAQTDAEPSAERYVEFGNISYNRGDYFVAQTAYQRALELDSNLLDAMIGKGRALVAQGAVDTGIEEYRRVIERDTRNLSARINMAEAYRERQRRNPDDLASLEQALTIANEAEGIDAQNARVANLKGAILFDLGNHDEARVALERAVNLGAGDEGPALAVYLINLGKAYRELGQAEQAINAFRRAVINDPESAIARNNLGDAYIRQDNCEQGVFELEQAVRFNSRSLDAMSNLGIALFDCGQAEQAIPRLEQAIAIDPVSVPGVYTYLARAYLEQGRADDAVTNASKGALLPPPSAERSYWLGRAYQARGNDEQARAAYQRALELDPSYIPAQEGLAALP